MKNEPLVITKNVKFSSVSIRSFWDVTGDESYINAWPRDRKLPFSDNTLVIIYTEKGNGIIRLNDKREIKTLGNNLTFLDPKTIKSYQCNGLIWKLFWIEIYIEPEIYKLIPKEKVIQIDNHRHFEIQFDELINTLEQKEKLARFYAAALFNKIFYEWLTMLNHEPHSKSYNNVKFVIEEMHHRLSENWQVKSMATFVGCSEQHLRKQFLTHTNRSPKDYYLQLKIDIALGVLKRGNKNVSQVATELGFSDPFHFSNVFKKRFGYSPSSVTPLANSTRHFVAKEIASQTHP
ncbi:AraC family transcriptional regulator [Vibrio sp. TH_r3]|uniref:helix-turn-helix transcriptional regulator n=1 Tax=Vibrio sp. TH_r3 TaxID=3082084 RepID=UPI002955C750|nr:AraC family transcriptional regulator [Vibrio sp. TH_r3]MDV7102811.1 AraC family transcriptional regulator [Vibrio sp. TH_r3]